MVRIAGLEPAHLAALPPQSSVSANSTICATELLMMPVTDVDAREFTVVQTFAAIKSNI